MFSSARGIFFTGTIVIWIIKWVLRPVYGADPHTLFGFLLGVAPNFIGSFLIPFAASWMQTWLPGYWLTLIRVHNDVLLRRTCVFGYALVVVNECLQLIPVFGRTFDWADLLFSLLAAGLSYVVFRRWHLLLQAKAAIGRVA